MQPGHRHLTPCRLSFLLHGILVASVAGSQFLATEPEKQEGLMRGLMRKLRPLSFFQADDASTDKVTTKTDDWQRQRASGAYPEVEQKKRIAEVESRGRTKMVMELDELRELFAGTAESKTLDDNTLTPDANGRTHIGNKTCKEEYLIQGQSYCQEAYVCLTPAAAAQWGVQVGNCSDQSYTKMKFKLGYAAYVNQNSSIPADTDTFIAPPEGCNMHHGIRNGFCEEFCASDDTTIDDWIEELNGITQGACQSLNYTKWVGRGLMKIYMKPR